MAISTTTTAAGAVATVADGVAPAQTRAAAKTAAKTANINVRVTKDVKAQAEELFASFGITLSDAINMFLHKSLMVEGLPFDLKQPKYNQETIAAFKEYDYMKAHPEEYKRYDNVTEALEDALK